MGGILTIFSRLVLFAFIVIYGNKMIKYENPFLSSIEKEILSTDPLKNQPIHIDQISKIELAILKQAIYEMKNSSLDKPIIISEAIRLAKRFGQDSSHKFVNALLDKAAN